MMEILPLLIQSGANVKSLLKQILYDLDLPPDKVDVLLPLTPHEIKARLENDLLKDGKYVDVDENDNDLDHLNIHYEVYDETEEARTHYTAHLLNYLRKANLEDPTQKKEKLALIENFLKDKNLPDIEDILEEQQTQIKETSGINELIENLKGQ